MIFLILKLGKKLFVRLAKSCGSRFQYFVAPVLSSVFDNSANGIWLMFFTKAKPFGTGKILKAIYFHILFDIGDRS